MNMNMLLAGMVLMVLVVVAVGDCCPCLPLRSAPPTLLRVEKCVEKSSGQANISLPTENGSAMCKIGHGASDGPAMSKLERQMKTVGQKGRRRRHFVLSLSVMTCTRHDYIYVYIVSI